MIANRSKNDRYIAEHQDFLKEKSENLQMGIGRKTGLRISGAFSEVLQTYVQYQRHRLPAYR